MIVQFSERGGALECPSRSYCAHCVSSEAFVCAVAARQPPLNLAGN